MKLIIYSILILICFLSNAQEQKRSVFLSFDPGQSEKYELQNPDYFLIEGDTIDLMYFIVKMGIGLDLCFTNEIARKHDYISHIQQDSLKRLDVKSYDWIAENYFVEDIPNVEKEYLELCNEILMIDSTKFYLVTKKPEDNTATIREVLNCNYAEY